MGILTTSHDRDCWCLKCGGEEKITFCVATNFPIPNNFNEFGQIGSSVNMCAFVSVTNRTLKSICRATCTAVIHCHHAFDSCNIQETEIRPILFLFSYFCTPLPPLLLLECVKVKVKVEQSSVEIPKRCSLVIEFIIPKFFDGSTCFEGQTAHHQEL
jgi:hypothetical protein